jgi:hypothetical protein
VPEIVIEFLEAIDVDQQHAERLAGFHRGGLRNAQKFVQCPAIGKPGERIGVGPLFRLVQGFADGVQFA